MFIYYDRHFSDSGLGCSGVGAATRRHVSSSACLSSRELSSASPHQHSGSMSAVCVFKSLALLFSLFLSLFFSLGLFLSPSLSLPTSLLLALLVSLSLSLSLFR